MSDCGGHDQGEDSRGDPEDLQYQEWLHAWGRGRSEEGESVGFWVMGWGNE